MQAIIDECKRIDKYERAMPLLEEMAARGGCVMYIAGTLIIKGGIYIDIEPISETVNETIRRGQYLASKIFVEHKEGSCFYEQAVQNVNEYEREGEPA